MKHHVRSLLSVLCLGLVLLLGACAQDVEDIDRTQPNKTKKADLDGVWYMLETVTSLPPTTMASFVGETSKMEKVVWRVEERYLFAYRAYSLLPGAANVDHPEAMPDEPDAPIAAFPILSHFDVQRQYNAQTGEQSNVIVENTSDRPWYERDYIRVDWSRNEVTNFDFLSDWFPTPIQASYTIDEERGLARSIYTERDEAGALTYFDLPRRLQLQPDWYGCIISTWVDWSTEDCTAAEAELVMSFAKTAPQRDYEALPYNNQHMTRFGYFRSERYVYDGERGPLESNRSRMINRHNIWQETYRKNGEGEFETDEEGRLIPIPITERAVKAVPYFLSDHFEDELLIAAAEDTMEQWNVIGKEAVASLQGIGVEQVPDVFVLCHYPVTDADHEVCGEPGFTPRVGDLRYSTLYWVESNQLQGPLGYGPSATDPETGETISGRAFVYGSGLNSYATYGLDVIRFLNGDIDPPELIHAQHVRDLTQRRASTATHVGRIAPALWKTPIGSPDWRDADKLAAREERRRAPKPFDGAAIKRRLDEAQRAGLSARVGGEELNAAMKARVGAHSWDALSDEQRAKLDPSQWMSPTHLREFKHDRLTAMARGIDFADMLDPNVIGIAAKYAGRDDYDLIWRELRVELFRATALHEVGHTLGLRHNFQGSYDSLNYFDEYWALRQETLFDPESMGDLFVLSEPTQAQLEGQMLEKQYSSIMDYGLTFNSDFQGLGRYDRAAIVYGYTAGAKRRASSDLAAGCEAAGGVLDPDDASQCLVQEYGLIQVFRKRQGQLGAAGVILTSTDDNGFRYDDPTSPIVPYLERWHYTTFIQSFPELDDAFDREWMPLADFKTATADGGNEQPVRVPYLFCSDEWEGALLSCRVFDAGADPYESTRNALDRYRAYYYFDNFKRDRLGWDPISVLYRQFYGTFLPISDTFQNWYLAPEGADKTMDDYYWLAIHLGFNAIAEALATPPYGTYCVGTDGDELYHLSDEPGQTPQQASDYFLSVYCDQTQPFHEIAQGSGRRRFSRYDVQEGGYYFSDIPLEAGHYWTTLAAFWALVDTEAYVLGSDADVGVFAISYYDFFSDEVDTLVNAILTEDYAKYSPTVSVGGDPSDAAQNTLRHTAIARVWDADLGLYINPETGEQLEKGTSAICETCGESNDCNGYTGFLEGTYCQPLQEGGQEFYCLQDCFEDATLCRANETCNSQGNCVPTSGTCDGHALPCSPDYPQGTCSAGSSCIDGACQAPPRVVQSDATFSLMTDVLFYGMLYTTSNYSTRFNDQINVFKLGTNEEISAGEGFEQVVFVDPISGDSYGALAEACDGPRGGAISLCDACTVARDCSGYTGALGGVWCSPLSDQDPARYCLFDCSDDVNACPSGSTCDANGNCIPDAGDCVGQTGVCDVSFPEGSCPAGETCFEGSCEVVDLSARCRYGLSTQSGAAQMIMRGQDLAQRYDSAVDAYWSDDGSNPALELQHQRDFSRARFELENHIEKINTVRATFGIFGRVY